ncbi:MAG: alpha/beta fold hydrolase [Polyangiales bacterium]
MILFLPGAAGRAAFWQPVAERLGAPHMLLSWPGLGGEPHDPRVRGLDDLVERVLAQMEQPVELVAQSMGGRIAIEVVRRAPDKVRRLVLTATSGGVPMPRAYDWRPDYRRNYPDAATWIADPQPDLSAWITRIAAPTLLLWGDADPISPVSVGEHLRSLLPDARLHVVRGGAHDLAVTHADEVAREIAAHL